MNTATALRFGLTLVPVSPSMSRLVSRSGSILGHVEVVETPDGEQFRAKRFAVAQRGFRELGEFWRLDDAVECLRAC